MIEKNNNLFYSQGFDVNSIFLKYKNDIENMKNINAPARHIEGNIDFSGEHAFKAISTLLNYKYRNAIVDKKPSRFFFMEPISLHDRVIMKDGTEINSWSDPEQQVITDDYLLEIANILDSQATFFYALHETYHLSLHDFVPYKVYKKIFDEGKQIIVKKFKKGNQEWVRELRFGEDRLTLSNDKRFLDFNAELVKTTYNYENVEILKYLLLPMARFAAFKIIKLYYLTYMTSHKPLINTYYLNLILSDIDHRKIANVGMGNLTYTSSCISHFKYIFMQCVTRELEKILYIIENTDGRIKYFKENQSLDPEFSITIENLSKVKAEELSDSITATSIRTTSVEEINLIHLEKIALKIKIGFMDENHNWIPFWADYHNYPHHGKLNGGPLDIDESRVLPDFLVEVVKKRIDYHYDENIGFISGLSVLLHKALINTNNKNVKQKLKSFYNYMEMNPGDLISLREAKLKQQIDWNWLYTFFDNCVKQDILKDYKFDIYKFEEWKEKKNKFEDLEEMLKFTEKFQKYLYRISFFF